MGEWKKYKLAEIAIDFAIGPFGSNIKTDNFIESGVPVIRGKNLNYHRYVDGDFVFLSNAKADELFRSNCYPGDLVFTHRGTIGQVCIIPEGQFTRYVVSQSGMKLTVNKDMIDENFLFYFFKTKIGQYELLQNESQVGVPAISSPLTSLKAVEIKIPSIAEQLAIISVVSNLDYKIELLQSQNKTLEAMAEALFRQWFVEEKESDWEVVTLEDVSKKITDGAHKSPATVDKGLPMASVKDMTQWGISTGKCRKISENDFKELQKADCQPLENDILIAKDGSYLKHVFVVEKDLDVVILSSIAIIRPNMIYHPLLLAIFLKLNSTKEKMENIVTGAVIPRIVLKDFRKFALVLPPKKKQDRALTAIEPLYKKCWSNNRQIRNLVRLRDTLLPKLMSGKVRVEYDEN